MLFRSFVRIKRMNRISIQAVAEHRPETEKWLLAYDCYQIEIIELASIIEVLFRDYFEALLFISCESKKDSFLEKMCSRLQAEFPGVSSRLSALQFQTI